MQSNPETLRGPVSPERAAELQTQRIPDEVFDVFNGLIAKNLTRGTSRVEQREVVDELQSRGLDSRTIFAEKWLDVEPSYRNQGWSVQYDSPCYDENYPPVFIFSFPK